MFIYTWYEDRFHAIKLGHGADAADRQHDYAKEYNLEPSDLRSVPMPAGLHVRTIEQALHSQMRERGFRVMPINGKNGGVAVELYALRDQSYDVVATQLLNEANKLGKAMAADITSHFASIQSMCSQERNEAAEARRRAEAHAAERAPRTVGEANRRTVENSSGGADRIGIGGCAPVYPKSSYVQPSSWVDLNMSDSRIPFSKCRWVK